MPPAENARKKGRLKAGKFTPASDSRFVPSAEVGAGKVLTSIRSGRPMVGTEPPEYVFVGVAEPGGTPPELAPPKTSLVVSRQVKYAKSLTGLLRFSG